MHHPMKFRIGGGLQADTRQKAYIRYYLILVLAVLHEDREHALLGDY